MADLNIRNVPDELLRQLKIEAVECGQTLRELAIEKLGIVKVEVVGVPVVDPEPPSVAVGYGGITRAEGEHDDAVESIAIAMSARQEGKRYGRKLSEHRPAKDRPFKGSRGVPGHPSICMCRLCEAARR
jgi:hypothetical protein